MTGFTIAVEDKEVRAAINQLSAKLNNMSGVTKVLAESSLERVKRRFKTRTDPDGNKWKPNTEVTIAMFSAHIASHSSYRKKNGELNKAGRVKVANKKPLTGKTGGLFESLHYTHDGQSATVMAGMPYAAIQNFGGKTGAKSWIPGAVIPARPFMGVRANGTLYQSERVAILDALNDYFTAHLK